MQQGYIHLYTGDGKGKTTAAIGVALRAVGADKKVFIGQFVKGMQYAEITSINKYLPLIEHQQYGLDCFINHSPTTADQQKAKLGLEDVKTRMQSDIYDLIIMDEICIALHFKLCTVKDLINAIAHKKHRTELILTGRYAPQELITIADLVTEMKEVKHYYQKGVLSRKGIDC